VPSPRSATILDSEPRGSKSACPMSEGGRNLDAEVTLSRLRKEGVRNVVPRPVPSER